MLVSTNAHFFWLSQPTIQARILMPAIHGSNSTYTAASVACAFFSCGPVSSQFVPRIVLIAYAIAQNTRQAIFARTKFARHADCRRRQSDFLACTRFHAHIFMP